MQIQMNGFHRLLANSRPKVDKSAWQASFFYDYWNT